MQCSKFHPFPEITSYSCVIHAGLVSEQLVVRLVHPLQIAVLQIAVLAGICNDNLEKCFQLLPFP